MTRHGPEPATRQGVDVSPLLTLDPDKRVWYGRDTYFIESIEQLGEITDDVVGFAYNHAVLLLKPEAVVTRRLGAALHWLGMNGFRVVAARPVPLNATMVRSLWYFQWNLATRQRRRLADLLIASADSVVLVVRRAEWSDEPASVRLTELKGPTDPQARTPGQLRYLLGQHSYLLNFAHTPDEPADVLRELGIYFDESTRAAVYAAALAGHDRTGEARDLAAQLYARVPSRDLDFAAALSRLQVAASRQPSLDPRVPLPELLEAAWRHHVDLDPWDVLVVGSQVLPMRRAGWTPTLDNASVDEWRTYSIGSRCPAP